MKIPKGTDLRLDTSSETVELHITAAITTKAQADELASAIRAFGPVLGGEGRRRRRSGAARAEGSSQQLPLNG